MGRQLGASSYGTAIAVDPVGDIYVTGETEGGVSRCAQSNAGLVDIFVAKYSTTGSQLWAHELGSSQDDVGFGIAVDNAGNAYIASETLGQLPGAPEPFAGFGDGYIAKYSTNGSRLWVHEIGAANSTSVGTAISVDGTGNVFLTGWTNGRLPGQPESNAGGYDAYIERYSSAASRIWVRRLGGAGNDYGTGIAAGASGVYVTGYTSGRIPGQPQPNAGDGSDVFVAKYATSGARLWTQQLGARGNDQGLGIAVDLAGDAYVTGSRTVDFRALRKPTPAKPTFSSRNTPPAGRECGCSTSAAAAPTWATGSRSTGLATSTSAVS